MRILCHSYHVWWSKSKLVQLLLFFSFSCTKMSRFYAEHLGQPIACNVVKLVDVPEFNICTKESGIGEICVKGTNVFSGYYKDHDTYQGQMDDEGWFHTNDIGMWLSVRYVSFCETSSNISNSTFRMAALSLLIERKICLLSATLTESWSLQTKLKTFTFKAFTLVSATLMSTMIE